MKINGDHHWVWENELPIDNLLGFVYVITNRSTRKRYFGRKQFWNKRGRDWFESDWRDYLGSSSNLSADIARFGQGAFEYRILAVFERKTGIALGEATAIVCSGCLEDGINYYNRAAPSIRGKLALTDFDAQQLETLRSWLRENVKDRTVGS